MINLIKTKQEELKNKFWARHAGDNETNKFSASECEEIQNFINSYTKDLILAYIERLEGGRVKYMWWCYGEFVGRDELEISHITEYPCKEHQHSSGSNVEAGFNQAITQEISYLRDLIKEI